MLRHERKLIGYRLGALDGEFGKVTDLYFDDLTWTVRYLVADTGNWLRVVEVLISPFAVKSIDDHEKRIEVSLTKQQIEQSPPVDTDQPVSRQYELKYNQYFGWPMYWYGPSLWGPGPFPVLQEPPEACQSQGDGEPSGNPHLQSSDEVLGYRIRAHDHEIGHVEDFLFDDENWAIRYLVVDTRTWWPGKKVPVSPQWIENVSWHEAAIHVELLSGTIKTAPEYNPSQPVTREYEASLYDHYDKDPYWIEFSHEKPQPEHKTNSPKESQSSQR